MSGSSSQRLIPANTTLLQPSSNFFRISDMINYGIQTAASAALRPVAAVASLEAQITELQTQIDALHARLAAAGIA